MPRLSIAESKPRGGRILRSAALALGLLAASCASDGKGSPSDTTYITESAPTSDNDPITTTSVAHTLPETSAPTATAVSSGIQSFCPPQAAPEVFAGLTATLTDHDPRPGAEGYADIQVYASTDDTYEARNCKTALPPDSVVNVKCSKIGRFVAPIGAVDGAEGTDVWFEIDLTDSPRLPGMPDKPDWVTGTFVENFAQVQAATSEC
jgi:hypothetical protein